MNSKHTYDIIISNKLEQVSVPDHAELIWSRIEKELDSDPGDAGNDASSPSPLPGSGFLWSGAGMLAVIGLLLYLLNSPGEDSAETRDSRQNETPVFSSPATGEQPVLKTSLPPVNRSASTGAEQGKDADRGDTTSIVPFIALDSPATRTDSALIGVSALPLPAVTDTLPARKKRGVQNISPDDYKIAPKKDSVHK